MPAYQEGPCVSTNHRLEPIKASFVSTFSQNGAYTCAHHSSYFSLRTARKYQLVKLKALKENTFGLKSVFFQNTLKGNT